MVKNEGGEWRMADSGEGLLLEKWDIGLEKFSQHTLVNTSCE